MMHARVAFSGAVHIATPYDATTARDAIATARDAIATPRDATAASSGAEHRLRLADGRLVTADEVVWLPPFEAGTIIALGLNYADHAKELAFNAQEEPLVFLKGSGSLIGHRGSTRRPADVQFMHYECELAVIIGRSAKHVRRAAAMEHVAGYCIANDYAIRDYLENWYRPNLRVKNRDGGTVLGPWFVDASDVRDPSNLGLRTFVNGKMTQRGNTRDLIFDIPYLIEYLSSFMTLAPGDVILTGTPEGVANVMPGDEIACEIDGLGRLVNTIAADGVFGRG
jgi:5-oxopent-3-ene-1,2,5-tricarboxylate decarboxylase/2-hydroxyhepta-2,4-diene-1,7-dioate isomerase